FFILVVFLIFGFYLYNFYTKPIIIKNEGDGIIVVPVDSIKWPFYSSYEVSSDDLVVEEIDKRTYNSQTFLNPDGSFTTEISSGRRFFYDGSKYVELSRLSFPAIEKKEVLLNSIPNSNVINFGTYTLHKGVNITIEDYNLVIKDANNLVLTTLPKPHSTDSDGNVSFGEYIIEIKEFNNYSHEIIYGFDNNYDRLLNLFVKVDKNWLENAKYPVVVDPFPTLHSFTGIYDGYVFNNSGTFTRNATDNYLVVGRNNSRIFIEFNTSSIPDNALIQDVLLTLNVSHPYGSGDLVSISRMNNSQPSNLTQFPDNTIGNLALYDTIDNAFYLVFLYHFQYPGIMRFDLDDVYGNIPSIDLQSQLPKDYFSVGIFGGDEVFDYANVTSSESSLFEGPLLEVRYLLPINYSTVLVNSTKIYDGYVSSLGGRTITNNEILFGDSGTGFLEPTLRGFIEFNTSSIPDNARITAVYLNVTVNQTHYFSILSGLAISISRMNNSQPSNLSKYPDDASGNTALFNDLNMSFYLVDLSDFDTNGTKTFDLDDVRNNLSARIDLESQLDRDFFAIGFSMNFENLGNLSSIISSEFGGNSSGPALIVEYSTDPCMPPVSYDWIINQTCNINGVELTELKNIIIQSAGILNISGGANISFQGNNQYIYINRLGQLYIHRKSIFGK
ncbi:MAG: hypothetical protein QXI33_03590, partial [Candidatus Pacearchaeota archaeon]